MNQTFEETTHGMKHKEHAFKLLPAMVLAFVISLAGLGSAKAACHVNTLTIGAQSVTNAAGISGSATFALSATENGSCGGVTFAIVSGLPTGATASFSPNGTGTASTMTISNTAATPSGTYTISVRGTD